ncbi:hypothetical protein V9K67_21630 [Paraflavisolibacter sp. H34]|uniref:hypothetical protein n=1 Tax=Huijunlia imazamoxiresistens TaxID=3127457 RepID=UPI003018D2DB
MDIEIVKDNDGFPLWVKMSYMDWLNLVHQYDIEPTPAGATGLNWFSLRESSNSILNSLLAHYGREMIKEECSGTPDETSLTALRYKAQEINMLLRNPNTFKSIESMNRIIAHFGPVIKAVNLAALEKQ